MGIGDFKAIYLACHQLLGLCVLTNILGGIAACGQSAKFGGAPAKAQAEALASPSSYQTLTWFWQCESDPVDLSSFKESDKEVMVKGGGEHSLPKEKIGQTELIFKGRLCPAESLKRDIVLVIDTSFSMSTNDPRAVDQCARLAATRALLSSLPPDARFGIVTFNSNLASYSTGLYADANQLFKDLSRNRTLADALCATEGGTNYSVAMEQASVILSKGRANATKEIYFVSDGQPDPGSDGVGRARDLKSLGVKIGDKPIPTTIATVMLAGVDTVLESQIASKDPSGKPLHAFAADMSQLTEALTSLSANEIIDATMRVKAIGAEDYATYDILGNSTGLDFMVPSITIDEEAYKQGLEVQYVYRDRRGFESSSGGRLIWQESTDGAKPSGVQTSSR